MNKARREQRFNLIFFFLSLLIALGVFAATAFLASEILTGEVDDTPPPTDACVAVLRAQGFSPTVHNNAIAAHRPAHTNIEKILSELSVGAAMCVSHKIEAFCAGQGCDKPGVSFKLVPRDD